MKKIKRLLVLAMSLYMTVGLLTSPIKATEVDTDNIMNYVVDGTGIFDNPYIFGDYENEFAKAFNNIVVNSMKNESLSTRHQFTASLTGARKFSQYNGGKWHYAYGGQGTGSNGSFVYSAINYVNEKDIELTYVAMTNSRYRGLIVDTLNSQGISFLYSVLVSNGLAGTMAAAVVKFFEIIPVAAICNQATIDQLADAVVLDDGSMVVSYKSSYNGSWFSSTASVHWDTYPTAYTPGEYYGIGNYYSN